MQKKPVEAVKQLVESLTNNPAIYHQSNVKTKTDEERASQCPSKKSMHLTIVPRQRKITLRKFNTEGKIILTPPATPPVLSGKQPVTYGITTIFLIIHKTPTITFSRYIGV